MASLPNWAPQTLGNLYQSRFREKIEVSNDDLLYRLLFDHRMEKVWKSINSRITPEDEFPMELFLILSINLSYEEPLESPEKLKKKYRNIADHAKALFVEMEESIFDRNGIRTLIHGIEESCFELEKAVDFSFLPYTQNMINFNVESPNKTILSRILYKVFMKKFNEKLWKSNATLVEVALDLPEETVTINFVRNTNEKRIKQK